MPLSRPAVGPEAGADAGDASPGAGARPSVAGGEYSNCGFSECGSAAGWPLATWPPARALASVGRTEADAGLTAGETSDGWVGPASGAGAGRSRAAVILFGAAAGAGLVAATRPGTVVPAGWARPSHCGLLGSLNAVRAEAGPPTPLLTVS